MENSQLTALANKYGSPLYVYDTDKIESQYNRLTNAFSSVKSLKLNYAVKALSNINILKFESANRHALFGLFPTFRNHNDCQKRQSSDHNDI